MSETYGEQEGTAYNGHFGCTCYHPLFCFNQLGNVEQSLLRDGNVHSAKDWREVLKPVMARYQGGVAPGGASLDVDDVAGETDQDRGEVRAPLPKGDLPNG